MENKAIDVKDGSSPAQIIQMAVTGGMDPEYLKDLLAVQKDWEANEARKAYHKAMTDFKSDPPKIDKDKKVGYSAGSSKVSYSHASLSNVVDKITKALSEHGLSASWTTEQNGSVSVTCCITHRMGHSERTTLSAPSDTSGSKNAIQAIGSTITYLQRYTLLSALGLATGEHDDDGVAAQTKYITEKQQHTICDLLIEAGGTEGPLLKYLGVEEIAKIPDNQYKKAVAAIEAKKNENN